jgi:hypothetical protein
LVLKPALGFKELFFLCQGSKPKAEILIPQGLERADWTLGATGAVNPESVSLNPESDVTVERLE